MFDLLIRDCIVVNADQPPMRASVAVSGEKIAAILPQDTDHSALRIIDGRGHVLFPGLIDPHVHYHYHRGYDDGSQDYDTETRSALMGGVTTAMRMHRELTPYCESLPTELSLLSARTRIDMALHLAIMTEEQLDKFPEAAQEYGLTSFKLYLAYKGQAGKLQGLQGADDGFLYDAMRRIGRFRGGLACVHAENSEIAERLGSQLQRAGRQDLRAWTEARPGWCEGEAIHRAGYIAYHAECPLYVVHVSSKEGVEAVENLRSRGMPLFAEVCIHHLTMTVQEAQDRLESLAKVTPPLRSADDVEALWDAVRRGVIDTVGTDHVAHSTRKQKVSLWEVMPGFSGSGTLLPALITEGYHKRGIPLSRIASLASGKAANIFGLGAKGQIEVGADADLVLVDLDRAKVVRAADLGSASDFSLYEGQALKGWPEVVILRGRVALADSVVQSEPGSGKFIARRAL